MKKTFLIYIIIISFMCFRITSYADTTEDYYDALEKSIPNHLSEFYSDKDITSPITSGDFLEYLLSQFKNYMVSPLTIFIELLFIIIISSVFHSFSHMIKNSTMTNIFEISVNICASLCILTNVYDCISESEIYIRQICDFSLSLSPIVSGICVLGGNVSSATVISGGITFFVGICQAAFIIILFPMIKLLFSLSVVCSFNESGFNLNGLMIVIKKTFGTILGFTVMFYSAVVSCQNYTSSAADSIGARTLRFTIGNIVPGVGASLGEAVRSVGGALSVLRQTVGGVGIAVVLLLVLPCIIRIVLYRFVFWLLSSFAGMLLCKNEALMIENIASVYGLTLALVVCSSIMLIFLLSVFSNLSTII